MEGQILLSSAFHRIESKIKLYSMLKLVALFAVASLALNACSTSPVISTENSSDFNTIKILAVGDLMCNRSDKNCADKEVAAFINNQDSDKIIFAGDISHEPSEEDNKKLYSLYGTLLNKIIGTPGNHDYKDPDHKAQFYFDFLNGIGNETGPAGNRNEGYYTVNFVKGETNVHVVAINSGCSEVGGCEKGSPQYEWLKKDLEENKGTKCTIVFWHRPAISSGNQSTKEMQDIFDLAQELGVDIVINGHDHHFESLNWPSGLRQFIVGTGGADIYWVNKIQPNSEVIDDNHHGVLKLTLQGNSYKWELDEVGEIFPNFTPISGADVCH